MGGSLTYRSDDLSVFRLELPSITAELSEEKPTSVVRLDGMERGMRTVGAGRRGVDIG